MREKGTVDLLKHKGVCKWKKEEINIMVVYVYQLAKIIKDVGKLDKE